MKCLIIIDSGVCKDFCHSWYFSAASCSKRALNPLVILSNSRSFLTTVRRAIKSTIPCHVEKWVRLSTVRTVIFLAVSASKGDSLSWTLEFLCIIRDHGAQWFVGQVPVELVTNDCTTWSPSLKLEILRCKSQRPSGLLASYEKSHFGRNALSHKRDVRFWTNREQSGWQDFFKPNFSRCQRKQDRKQKLVIEIGEFWPCSSCFERISRAKTPFTVGACQLLQKWFTGAPIFRVIVDSGVKSFVYDQQPFPQRLKYFRNEVERMNDVGLNQKHTGKVPKSAAR